MWVHFFLSFSLYSFYLLFLPFFLFFSLVQFFPHPFQFFLLLPFSFISNCIVLSHVSVLNCQKCTESLDIQNRKHIFVIDKKGTEGSFFMIIDFFLQKFFQKLYTIYQNNIIGILFFSSAKWLFDLWYDEFIYWNEILRMRKYFNEYNSLHVLSNIW